MSIVSKLVVGCIYNIAIINQTGQNPSQLFDFWKLNKKERENALGIMAGIAMMPPDRFCAVPGTPHILWLRSAVRDIRYLSLRDSHGSHGNVAGYRALDLNTPFDIGGNYLTRL